MISRITLTGCSGVGKTTLAQYISQRYGLPFISGSYSDLVPATKQMPHSDMIGQGVATIVRQDYQVVNLRSKALRNQATYVTDRSYVDSMAYWIQKLSHRVASCDTTDFVGLCATLLRDHVDGLIYIPFSLDFLDNWQMEDNNKRVLNKWYQYEVTAIINSMLAWMGTRIVKSNIPGTNSRYGLVGCKLENFTEIPILILDEMDYEKRLELVDDFINSDLWTTNQ